MSARLTPAELAAVLEHAREFREAYERGEPLPPPLPPFPANPSVEQSPTFLKAAAEARDESRRYWAKGGPADLKYPILPIKRPNGEA